MVSSSWGSYHPVRKISKKVAPVCSTKTCICKLLQQRIGIEVAPVCSTKTCVYKLLQQRIEIEASYITVHLYDILVINTHPQLCLGLM